MPKSEKAKEGSRRRQREYHRRRKEKQSVLADILPVATPVVDSVMGGVQHRLTSKISQTLADGIASVFKQSSPSPSKQGLADNTVRKPRWLQGVLYSGIGATAGYAGGSLLHKVVYSGIQKTRKDLPKYRLYGMGIGAVAAGALWWLNEQPVQEEGQGLADADAEATIQLQEPMTLGQLSQMNFEKVFFTQEFEGFFGGHANKHDVAVIHGKAGSAKSHFAAKVAGSLQQQGRVLYISTEENPSQRVTERFARYRATHVLYVRARSVEEVLHHVKTQNPRFLVLDSISNLGLGHDDEKRLLAELRRRVDFLLLVLHHTKEGTYRGSSGLLHEADIEVFLEDGVATTGKNRMNTAASKTMNLFPQTGNVFPIPISDKTAQM
jgi:hypothetical protein